MGLSEKETDNSKMSKRRTVHFTTEGLRPQVVEIAPDAQDPISKRNDIIKQEDDLLNNNLVELDVGTKARNRAFQTRLDEIWSQTAGWEAKLKTEAREAAESMSKIREDYGQQMDLFLQTLLSEMNAAFDRYDCELIPRESKRVDVIEASLNVFVKEIVPAEVERQSGEVSRQLKKAYETFDIEQQKEAKREKKFVGRASDHIQHTAQRFNDEEALRTACFFTLEEDVVEYQRRAARMHHRRLQNAITSVYDLDAASRAASAEREAEDMDVLQTVIETQGLLQKVVLEHFGDTDSREFPKMEKLEKRMNKKKAK